MSVHEGQPHSFVGCLAKLLLPCDGGGDTSNGCLELGGFTSQLLPVAELKTVA